MTGQRPSFTKTHIFVYGTLKKGGRYHRLLKGARFLRVDETKEASFALIPIAKDVPGLLLHGDRRVSGEVYEVSSSTLKRLDALEEEGQVYGRAPIELATSGRVETYFYLLASPQDRRRQLGRPGHTVTWPINGVGFRGRAKDGAP